MRLKDKRLRVFLQPKITIAEFLYKMLIVKR